VSRRAIFPMIMIIHGKTGETVRINSTESLSWSDSPQFTEPEKFLTSYIGALTGPYPEPDVSSPYPGILFLQK
jgi:hypothetical protein